MRIELINTGAELLVGRVLNTHQQWLCRQLTDLGYEVSRQVCVTDDGEQIQAVARESLQRAEVIITTGGLGPTSDDRTRDFVRKCWGGNWSFTRTPRARMNNSLPRGSTPCRPMFASRRWSPKARPFCPMPTTAPGLALETKGGKQWLILLPGPPRELRPMFIESVVPLLRREFPLACKYLCRTIKTTGLGESVVEEKIDAALRPLVRDGLELAYCARVGEVDVRLAGRGEKAEVLLAEGMARVERLLGPVIFGREDDSLESVVIGLLTSGKKTVAVAESCTGGFLAHRLTNVPGASAVFVGGVVAYSSAIKRAILGVREETLRQHGAVSEPAAREMAEGARRLVRADYALAVTGIAGPGGGTPEKPVGTAYVGLSENKGTTVQFQ